MIDVIIHNIENARNISELPIAVLISLLFSLQHSISNTDVRLNELWRVRGRLEFFSQRNHKYAERGDIIVPASPPYFLCNISMRQDFPSILGKKAEQLKLDRCQF